MNQKLRTRTDGFKLYSVFTGIFVSTLIISNVASSAKIVSIGPFAFPGGAIIFPISFIFGDILTEVYGYARSRRVIWTGFFCLLLATLTFYIVQIIPGAAFWKGQEAYDTIFSIVPRVVAGSMTAYFLGEFCNSWVLSKMKYWARGGRGLKQAWRFVASTIVGEGVDSIVVLAIGFSGVLSLQQMLQVGGSLYVFKVLYEIIATPVSTRFSNWIKRVEGVDQIDFPDRTNYSPFAGLGVAANESVSSQQ